MYLKKLILGILSSFPLSRLTGRVGADESDHLKPNHSYEIRPDIAGKDFHFLGRRQ